MTAAAPFEPLDVSILPGDYAICYMSPLRPIPTWLPDAGVVSITRTETELSVVCLQRVVPAEVAAVRGWRCLMVVGPINLSAVGVLSSIAAPLAAASVSIIAISSFETDYVLIRAAQLDRAVAALSQAGHRVG